LPIEAKVCLAGRGIRWGGRGVAGRAKREKKRELSHGRMGKAAENGNKLIFGKKEKTKSHGPQHLQKGGEGEGLATVGWQ